MIDKAYGKKADEVAEAKDGVVEQVISDLPTLTKLFKGFYGKVKINFIDAFGPKNADAITNIRTQDNIGNPTGEVNAGTWANNPYINFYRMAFSSYRELAHIVLHEFGHATSFLSGNFYNNYKRYGGSWNNAVLFDEVYAYRYAHNMGGRLPNSEQRYINKFQNSFICREL